MTAPVYDKFWIKKARVPVCLLDPPDAALSALADRDGLALVDLRIEGGRVRAVLPAGTAPCCGPGMNQDGGQVWPCPIDLHAHLDKGHIGPRADNPEGNFDGAIAAVAADREARWTAADLRARMEFGLRCAFAHGTRAVRTHLDSVGPQAAVTWPVFAELRERWAGRIDLQGVALTMPEAFQRPEGRAIADLAAEHGGILGAVVWPMPGLDEVLDRVFTLAAERALSLDFHVDETTDPAADGLRRIAETALRHRFAGGIVCGHACSLAVQPEEEARRTLELVAAAGIGVVTLPMCNLYLQDRAPGRTPRRRGVTLVHELHARGIPVAVASDNCRDPFYGYGDHDMVEVYTQAVRILHLDRPHGDWPRAATAVPADLMGLKDAGRIGPGRSADLVLFRARGFSELLSRPQADRLVLRAGRPIEARLPDYRELDNVLGTAAP